MIASGPTFKVTEPSSTDTPRSLAVEQVYHWCEVLDHFVLWQNEHILRSEVSTQQREGHREELKWLLRLTKQIYSTASDPEFPDRSLLAQLEAQMRQLEESWEQFYNPISAAEAERILAETFPNGR